MKTFCDFHGLLQIVRQPTRNDYLLDLAITDIGGAKADILSYIADHKGVLVKLSLTAVSETEIKREVWDLKNADWKALHKELSEMDWSSLKKGTAEDAVNLFHELLWFLLIKYIPRKEVKCKKSSHPWMNSRCEKVIFEKMNAEGSEQYEEKSKRCSEVLQEERSKYTEKLKAKLASLPRSSKQWWRINRELLQR